MSLAHEAYDELVYGGHLLAIGTSSIAASIAFILGRSPSWDLLLMAYLFSFGAYSINRTSDFEEDRISHPARTAYLESRRRTLPVVAAACFALGYALAFLRNLEFFAALLIPLVLALAYSVSSDLMSGLFGMSRLKEGLLVKNIVISFGWALIPFLVGLYYLDLPFALLAITPFVFLRLMVNTVFFDIRDVDADRAKRVRTLPLVIGTRESLRLLDVIDLAAGAYVLVMVLLGVLPVFSSSLFLLTPYSMAYRYYSRWSAKHEDSVRDLAADGEYVLWGVVTYLGQL